MARLIAIDGLDGSGKNTQSALLADFLQKAGQTVRLLSFPTYQEPASALVNLYLAGGLGAAPEDTGAYAASTFFACDRYVSFRSDWQKDYERPDGVVIANRYTTANAVHQLSKLPKEKWESFLSWLWDFEFGKLGLPAPDEVVYLEVLPQVAAGLIDKRGQEKDIHEKNLSYLENSYEAALFCAETLGWKRIRCCQDGKMKSREEIFLAMKEALQL
ncbi:MAG: deoxynucleoside kinase [Clostridiales bacterium]|nr:deoxynucleoside kinase [Clostridiales bacterium]